MAAEQSPDDLGTRTEVMDTARTPGGARAVLKGPKGRLIILAIALVLVVVLIAITVTQCSRTQPTNDAAQVAPAAAEVFLEPAATVGDSPFAPASVATEQPDPASPGTDPLGPPPPAPPPGQDTGAMAVRTANGDLLGLYGGTADLTTCDATLLIDYLNQNPDKGRAWSSVHRINPDQIPAYVAELTPVLLRTDTRVTDHGYLDVAQALPRQSVLQAGTAVLVDKYGSPRVRCISGSPLLDPVALTAAPPPRQAAPPTVVTVVQQVPAPRVVFVGPRWPRFDPLALVVIRRVLRIIDLFVLWDFRRGTVFGRQLGILIRDIIDLANPRLRRLIPPNLLLAPPPRQLPPRPPVQRLPVQQPPVQQPRQAPQGLPNKVVPVQQAPAPPPVQAPPAVPAPPPVQLPPIIDVFEPQAPVYDPPVFTPPVYSPPVYDDPGVYGPAPHSEPEPIYNPPVYTPPTSVYTPPTYSPPVYDPPSSHTGTGSGGHDDTGTYVPPVTGSNTNPDYPALPAPPANGGISTKCDYSTDPPSCVTTRTP